MNDVPLLFTDKVVHLLSKCSITFKNVMETSLGVLSGVWYDRYLAVRHFVLVLDNDHYTVLFSNDADDIEYCWNPHLFTISLIYLRLAPRHFQAKPLSMTAAKKLQRIFMQNLTEIEVIVDIPIESDELKEALRGLCGCKRIIVLKPAIENIRALFRYSVGSLLICYKNLKIEDTAITREVIMNGTLNGLDLISLKTYEHLDRQSLKECKYFKRYWKPLIDAMYAEGRPKQLIVPKSLAFILVEDARFRVKDGTNERRTLEKLLSPEIKIGKQRELFWRR